MELTGITAQNRDFFKHLAPIELLKRAGTFGYYGIGAAEGERPELVGAGTVLFCIRKDSLQESYATIEWIYVREDLRRQGIGLALLSKMESGIASKGPESICIDLPTHGHEELKELLRKAGYHSAFMEVPFYELSVNAVAGAMSNIPDPDKIENMYPLMDVSLSDIMKSSNRIAQDRYVEDLGVIASQPKDYFEQELSYVHEDKGEADGWILVHDEGNKVFSITSFEGTRDCRIGTMNELFSGCVAATIYKYGKESVFHIPIRSEEELDYLANYVREGQQRIVERFVKPLKS